MSGTRNTSTRIVLEGEAEYRAALKNINQEYSLTKSELEKVNSAFRGQQNTVQALQQKYTALSVVLDSAQKKLELEKNAVERSRAQVEQYGTKLEEAKRKLAALESGTDDAAKGTDTRKPLLMRRQK